MAQAVEKELDPSAPHQVTHHHHYYRHHRHHRRPHHLMRIEQSAHTGEQHPAPAHNNHADNAPAHSPAAHRAHLNAAPLKREAAAAPLSTQPGPSSFRDLLNPPSNHALGYAEQPPVKAPGFAAIDNATNGTHPGATAVINADGVNSYYARTGITHDDCARRVREALEAGGVHLDTSRLPTHIDKITGKPTHYAKDYGSALMAKGYVPEKIPLKDAPLMAVAVFKDVPGHEAGHMQVLAGTNTDKQWHSSFPQKTELPAAAYADGGYTVYVPGKVLGGDQLPRGHAYASADGINKHHRRVASIHDPHTPA